ncbi:MAG: DUF58 domain-containing protein [Gammaproteobacteria bacterium]|nr:DUF58 domain-containing protein [Gammaproteobacteria bacterium]
MSFRPAAHVLLALIILAGIVGLWAGESFPPVWRILADFSVFGLAFEFWRCRSVQINIERADREALHLGRDESIELRFHNQSDRLLSLQYQPDFPDAIHTPHYLNHFTVAGNSSASMQFAVRAVAVGEYRLPTARIRIAGPLGLSWWTRFVTVDVPFAVIPDTLRKRGQRQGTVEAEGLRTGITGKGLELHHLREYRPGDPRQTIDWKASARLGSWMTRVHIRELELRIVVLLDTGRTSRLAMAGLDQLGHYINVTARLLEYAALHDDQVGLVIASDGGIQSIPPANGFAAVHRIRSALGALKVSEAHTDLMGAAMAVRRMVSQRCLVFLLSDLEQGTTGNPLAAAIRTLAPKHLPVAVGMVSPEVHQLAEGEALNWLDPWNAAAARTWRQQLDSSAESLRRMGAIALTATPDELEARVFDTYRTLRLQRRAG